MEANITPEILNRVLDLGKGASTEPMITDGGHEVIVVPSNWSVIALEPLIEKYRDIPRRQVAAVAAHDVATFVAYWKRHASDGSIIFGDASTQKVTACIDYHKQDGTAGWRQHTVTFGLTPTVEWQTWIGSNGKKMSQESFAQFIEDNAPDVVDSAKMLEVALRLEATKSVNFVSGKRLQDGKSTLVYQEEAAATVGKDKMDVPESFQLRLVPYQGVSVIEIEARLRYRIQEQKLVLWYDLLRPHKVTEMAFDDAVEKIAAGCGAEVLMGKA